MCESSSCDPPKCIGCGTELKIDHTGIKCLQDHNICPTCTPNFIKTIFEDPHGSIPVKCSICKTEIPSLIIERQLTDKQKDFYLALLYEKSIGKDEVKQGCPFCPYFEVWPLKNEMNFLFCKNKECQKTSCSICHKSITSIKEGYEQEEESKYNEIEKDTTYHFECMELGHLLKEFEKTIEQGEKMYCPGCGAGGRKDDSCTHMTCSACQTIWCYMCGLSVNQCNKNDSKGNISSHNEEWISNPKRCPMYFIEIQDVDDKWPSEDELCLSLFHKKRTLFLLQSYVKKIGISAYKSLTTKFSSVMSCGYSIDEILGAKDEYFKRE